MEGWEVSLRLLLLMAFFSLFSFVVVILAGGRKEENKSSPASAQAPVSLSSLRYNEACFSVVRSCIKEAELVASNLSPALMLPCLSLSCLLFLVVVC